MSVNVTYQSRCTVLETLETNIDSLGLDKEITHNAFNTDVSLTVGTTPPATKVAAFVKALDAGAGTIDLTALTGTNGAAVNGTGLKVQVFKIKNLGENTLTIEPGVATDYLLLGAAFKIILAQNQEFLFYGNDAAPDIGADDKVIKLTGTLVETCEVTIVMG